MAVSVNHHTVETLNDWSGRSELTAGHGSEHVPHEGRGLGWPMQTYCYTQERHRVTGCSRGSPLMLSVTARPFTVEVQAI